MKYTLTLLSLFFFINCFSQQQTVYFDYAKWDLSSETTNTLNSILKDHPDTIHVVGHCDNRGTNKLNTPLSEMRANSVKQYLLSKDNTLIITTEGKSFNIPKSNNSTDKGRANNRRAEIFYKLPTQKTQVKKTETSNLPKVNSYKCQVIDQKGAFIDKGIITLYSPNNKVIGSKSFKNGKFKINDSIPFSSININGERYFSQLIKLNRIEQHCLVRLQEIKKKSYFTFHNLGFVPNETTLLDSSYPELDGLVNTLISHPRLKIHIEGHTSGVNTTKDPSWHDQISTGRANSVYTYLIEKGINKDRLQFSGFGCSKMVFPQAINKRQAQANRRVEIRVTDY